MTYKTSESRRAAVKRYTERNPEKIKAARQKRQTVVREFIENYRRAAGCVDCGTHDGRLEFHHRDPDTKNFEIGRVTNRSIAVVEAEIALCDVLCAGCHRRRHQWVPACNRVGAETN